MSLALTAEQFGGVRHALLGENSESFIAGLFRLNRRHACAPDDVPGLRVATEFGLVSEGALTHAGWLVSDSIREYTFWLQRDRRVHSEHHYGMLAPEKYAGMSVLEPGSGFGCNLLSLARVSGRFVGVEPIAVYRQLTSVFAEREGLPIPSVVAGSCEALPFGDAEFDRVLLYSAHQYMDLTTALPEIARVLRSGGQMHIIGPTLDAQLSMPRTLAEAKHCAVAVVNTLTYERIGRRPVRLIGGYPAVVYPRYRFMRRFIAEAGLTPRDDLSRRVGDQTCFVADKR